MPELSTGDLLGEWRRLMDSVVDSAASVGSRAEIPRQLLEPMQKQVELLQDVIERERRVQRQVAGRLLAPVDAVFDLLAESGLMLRRQAEALEAAGRALEETGGLVRKHAELIEQTISALREPTELAKVAAGLDRTPKKPSGRKSAGRKPKKASRRKSADRKQAKPKR